MKIERVDAADPRAVLHGLRGAVLGAGPAIALGLGGGARGGGGAGAGARPGGGAGAAGIDLGAQADAGRGPGIRLQPGPGAAGDAAAALARGLPTDVPAGTAVVVATSGSTGYPKLVVLSRSALTASALATADRIGEGAWLLALPAGYVAGVQVLVRSLVSGREPAILAGSFSAHSFAAAAGAMASSEGGRRVPTYTSLVPAQLQTILAAVDAGDADAARALSSFEAILVGGQALAPALADRAAAAGARIVRTYGASETSGGCVYDGAPLRGVDIRVVDGEVQVSGPMLADGYFGDAARTDAAFVRDAEGARWYRTGDVGTFDAGRVRIDGRRDNVIVSGGINVSLDRVEKVVRAVPGFAGAVVLPVPDARWGQASVVVVAGEDSDADVEASGAADAGAQVRAAVAAALGAPARPRAIVRVAAIPLLASGKPDRAALRALVQAHTETRSASG